MDELFNVDAVVAVKSDEALMILEKSFRNKTAL